jgi:hypothetical protein
LESLAVRWLFPGKEIRIDARCLDCGEAMLLRFRDEELLEKSPASLVAHVVVPLPRWREVSLSFN